jgi:hypothetical protein
VEPIFSTRVEDLRSVFALSKQLEDWRTHNLGNWGEVSQRGCKIWGDKGGSL